MLTRAAATALLLSFWSCGGSPAGPTPPTPVFFITCPDNLTHDSPDGEPVTVEYSPPSASGGTSPVTVSCTPQAPGPFPVGTNAVVCEARDAAGLLRTCGFNVIVRPPPRLSVTRFLAFGDSLTEGTVAVMPTFLVVSGPQSYPFKLRNLLTSAFRTQTFEIINEGLPGEEAIEGVQRLGGVLRRHRPEVLLLMQGSNDLTLQQNRAFERALPAIEQMVEETLREGVKVCLATVPPQRPGGRRDFVASLVPAFNEGIRAIAARHQAVLVDVYKAMESDLSLIGADDLHPNDRGYQVIAETFFAAIRQAFEVK